MNDAPRRAPGIGPQVAPAAAVGLLIVAAAGAHAAAEASGHTAEFAATVGALAFVLAVVVGSKTGQRIRCPKGRRRLRWLLMSAAVWLGSVTATGLTWGWIEAIAFLTWALSFRWWQAKRIPDAAMETASPLDGFAALWKEKVGRKGKPLVGSLLTDEEKIKSGTRFTLRLVPGEHTQDSVETERKKIRGALGLMPAHDLLLEQHPTLPEPHLLLTIVTRQPKPGSVLWPGPSVLGADGRIALGPFADGEGTASWKAFTANRVWGGFLQGGTGSGKSRMIESIVMALAASDLFPSVVWWADGQWGASSKLLKKRCDKVALSVAQCKEMLQGVIRIMEHRQDENDVEDLDGFTPTTARPAIFVILDECHVFFLADDDIKAMCARITREGGKVGVALICATQQAQLAAAFGGGGEYADAIRSNLLAGNGVLLRGKSKSAQQIFGVEVDPTQFPDRPGYAFLADPAEGARRAPLLGYFVSDDLQKIWPDRFTWRELDAGAANAYGPAYFNRVAIAAAARAEKLARVQARRDGRPVAGPIASTVSAAAARIPKAMFPILKLPVWVNPTRIKPQADLPTPTPLPEPPKVTDVHRRIMAAVAAGDAMENGYTMPGLLAAHLGLSRKWTGIALGELIDLGVMERPADAPQGKYYPTGKQLPTEKVA